jgi:hypothetical protein
MDMDAAGFVLDRIDVARQAMNEAQQVVGKFAQPEDDEVARKIEDLLSRLEQLDATVRAGSYPSA